MKSEDIEHRFSLHPVASDVAKFKQKQVYEGCKALAHNLNDLLPDGREKSLAMTHLEDVVHSAIDSITRNQQT